MKLETLGKDLATRLEHVLTLDHELDRLRGCEEDDGEEFFQRLSEHTDAVRAARGALHRWARRVER